MRGSGVQISPAAPLKSLVSFGIQGFFGFYVKIQRFDFLKAFRAYFARRSRKNSGRFTGASAIRSFVKNETGGFLSLSNLFRGVTRFPRRTPPRSVLSLPLLLPKKCRADFFRFGFSIARIRGAALCLFCFGLPRGAFRSESFSLSDIQIPFFPVFSSLKGVFALI